MTVKHHVGSNPPTMAYDAANRLVTMQQGSNIGTYTFDANGNMTGERIDAIGVLTTWVYDGENRPINEIRSSSVRHTYTYAPDGLRRSAHHGGTANPVAFVWDGDDLLNEYIGGSVSCRYDDLDGEVLSEKRGANRYLYVPDPLGSLNHLLDTGQTIAGAYTFWPYGEVQSHTGPDTPLQFAGALGYYTGTVNRAYVRARWYRPDLGRWQTVDPCRPDEDEASLYEYAGGTPFVAVDPSGLEFISWCCVKIRGRCYGCCKAEPKCPPRRRRPAPKPSPPPPPCPTAPCAPWEAIFHSCGMACRQKGDPTGGWCSDCCQDLRELIPDNMNRDAWFNRYRAGRNEGFARRCRARYCCARARLVSERRVHCKGVSLLAVRYGDAWCCRGPGHAGRRIRCDVGALPVPRRKAVAPLRWPAERGPLAAIKSVVRGRLGWAGTPPGQMDAPARNARS